MFTIKTKSLGETWVEYLRYVLADGISTYDAREYVLEASPVTIELSGLEQSDSIIEAVGKKETIDVYTRKMFSRELIPELNSTYGDRLFNARGVDQIDWIIKRLKANQWTKAAFISLVLPDDPGPRVPCLSSIQFAVRNKELNLHATYRSQNAFNSYANFLGVHALHMQVANDVGFPVGKLFSVVHFPHIYTGDVSASREIVARFS
jgi:thymidylate synthase